MNLTPPSPNSVIISGTEHQHGSPSRGGHNLLFPWKLHQMLSACVSNDNENIASWVSDGKAFRVHNTDIFVSKILPLFFNQTKYKSFQRQLNLWGFQRIQNGPDRGAYHHKLFLRDQPNLCSRLTRQKSKKMVSMDRTKNTMDRGSLKMRTVWPNPPNFTTLTRQISEGSTEVAEKTDAIIDYTLDIAEFDGAPFHPLEQERYDELDLEFESLIPGNQLQNNSQSGLLQELELGLFGIPKGVFII